MTDRHPPNFDFMDEIAAEITEPVKSTGSGKAMENTEFSKSTVSAETAASAVTPGQPRASRKRKASNEPLTKAEIDALITGWTESGLSIIKMVSELATRGTRISSTTVRARMQALGLKSMNKAGPSREAIAKGPWLNRYRAEIEGLAAVGTSYARIWHELRTKHPGDPMLARTLSDNVRSNIISNWISQERKKVARQQSLPERTGLFEPIRKVAPAPSGFLGHSGYPGYPTYPDMPGMPGPAYMTPPPGYVAPSPAPASVTAPGVTAPASKVSKAAAAPAKKSISVPASDDSSTSTDSADLDSLTAQDWIKAQNKILAAKKLQGDEAAKEAAAANPLIEEGQRKFYR
jgi:hypothetical protein